MKTQRFLAFLAAVVITFFLTVIMNRLFAPGQVGTLLSPGPLAAREDAAVDHGDALESANPVDIIRYI